MHLVIGCPSNASLQPSLPASHPQDRSDLTMLHLAAMSGHSQVISALLAAGASPMRALADGSLPLHFAVMVNQPAAARVLLAAAPQAADVVAGGPAQQTPLFTAVLYGHLHLARLIVEAAPHTAAIRCFRGQLPIHAAAAASEGPSSVAMVQLLLDAAPDTAASLVDGTAPVQHAAMHGNAAAARLLRQATPVGCLEALQTAVCMAVREAPDEAQAYLDTARALLPAVQPAEALPLLVARGDLTLPLFPELAMDWPLTAAQWQQVPSPCPGLGRALPAVHQRSEEEAALLVAHLPPADSTRLRTFALALHRSQRRLGIHLPSELVHHLLSLFDC